jgi:hypothetical protein
VGVDEDVVMGGLAVGVVGLVGAVAVGGGDLVVGVELAGRQEGGGWMGGLVIGVGGFGGGCVFGVVFVAADCVGRSGKISWV